MLKTIIQDHKDYRKQIWKLAKSDLIKTYRGSALGWTWAIIKPAVTIFVYWFAFSFGLRKGGDVGGYPFFLWLIAGICPWFYMSEMLTQGTDCIRKNRYLVTKMKFPVSTIPTFTSISKFVVHLMLLALIILIFTFAGYPPTIYMLQLPFYMLCLFAFFTAWGLFAAPIATISDDFSNLVKSFVTAIFWLSGILWNADSIKEVWLHRLLMCNPVTFLSNGYRNCFVNQTWFFEEPKQLLAFSIAIACMMLLGLWSYKRTRKEMPDVL